MMEAYMAFIETPEGLVPVRETKSFMQVQTENRAAKKAGLVQDFTCGVPVEMPPKVVEKPKSLVTLEKQNG
jgi:hypothetical protein